MFDSSLVRNSQHIHPVYLNISEWHPVQCEVPRTAPDGNLKPEGKRDPDYGLDLEISGQDFIDSRQMGSLCR